MISFAVKLSLVLDAPNISFLIFFFDAITKHKKILRFSARHIFMSTQSKNFFDSA